MQRVLPNKGVSWMTWHESLSLPEICVTLALGVAYIYCNHSAFRTCGCWLLSSSFKSYAAGDRRCTVVLHPLRQPRHSALQLLRSGIPKITTDYCKSGVRREVTGFTCNQDHHRQKNTNLGRWRQVTPKHWNPSIRLHIVRPPNTVLFITKNYFL